MQIFGPFQVSQHPSQVVGSALDKHIYSKVGQMRVLRDWLLTHNDKMFYRVVQGFF